MSSFRIKDEQSSVPSHLIAAFLAVAAIVLPAWSAARAIGFSSVLAIHITVLNAAFGVVFAMMWQSCATYFGVYDGSQTPWHTEGARILRCAAVMTGVLGIYLKVKDPSVPMVRVLGEFLLLGIACELLRFWLARGVSPEPERAIIVGSGRPAMKAWRELRTHQWREKVLVGFVDERELAEPLPDIADRYLGEIDDLPQIALQTKTDELISVLPLSTHSDEFQKAIEIAQSMGMRFVCLKDTHGIRPDAFTGEMFLELVPAPELRGFRQRLKRALDIGVSALVLLIGSPVVFAYASVAAVRGSGSVLRYRTVYGYRRRQFRMYCFQPSFERRLKRVGLAKWPQMWSVLRGEMSLAGPRALSEEEISMGDLADFSGRFSVRPGLTRKWKKGMVSDPAVDLFEELSFDSVDR